ncbi:MAG TPA: LytTR family transcriptional regulator DNA-binding domain-containing protein [Bryobacteraceae bacterium]|nr:LytTR family transcriptional regulator DNA-binding domain-containing protein [Bryobacteraceae bacterium]
MSSWASQHHPTLWCISGDFGYCRVRLGSGKPPKCASCGCPFCFLTCICRDPMNSILLEAQGPHFCGIHRSTIVNLARIQEMDLDAD